MKINQYFKNNKWMPYAMAGCVTVLFYLLASHINYFFIGLRSFLGYISPVIIGLIMAYILDPLVKVFENNIFSGIKAKPGIKRLLSVWVTIILVLLTLVVFMFALVPQIVKSLGTFFANFDSYATSLQSILNSISLDAAENSVDISNITKILDTAIENLADYIQKNLGNIVNTSINAGMTVISVVMSFILAIYMLSGKERLKEAWKRFLQGVLSDKSYSEISVFWNRCNQILIRYIAGDILDGVIVGIVNFIFMSICRMDYAALISVIVGLTNLAPTFGPLAGAVIGAFFLVFVNPWFALWFLIFTAILQTLDGYIIKPKLFGNTLGVSSLWILISIIVLGRMFGIPGILLAIPFAAISDIIYKEIIIRKLEQRKEERKIALAEEEEKKAAGQAAMLAAKKAIKAVVDNDRLAAEAGEKKEGSENDI